MLWIVEKLKPGADGQKEADHHSSWPSKAEEFAEISQQESRGEGGHAFSLEWLSAKTSIWIQKQPRLWWQIQRSRQRPEWTPD